MSGDLRVAYVRWDCADGFKHRLEKHFDKNKGRLRHAIGQSTRLKYTPELKFRYDTLSQYQEQMDEAIDRLEFDRNITQKDLDGIEEDDKADDFVNLDDIPDSELYRSWHF